MATTTPNFGWSVPTSSDLVKNGATAIETLGDSIDASLVDLKGGTTGQVLSKASSTDMDFTWVADATGDTTLIPMIQQYTATESVLKNVPSRIPAAEQLLKQAVYWIDAAQSDNSDQVLDNQGWGAPALTTQLGSSASADSNDPKFLDFDGINYVYLPGVSGNALEVPDSAALDITGDIDLRIQVAMDDWTPSSTQVFIAKETTGSTRSFRFYIASDGKLYLLWSTDGSATTFAASSVATGITDGTTKWIRATLSVASNYKVKFFTSDNGTTWIQLGTDVDGVGATSIFASTSNVSIGTRLLAGGEAVAGKLYRTQILNGIDGTKVLDVNTSIIGSGSATSFSALTGQTVTINRSASGKKAAVVTHPVWLFGTDDYMEVADNDLIDFGATDSMSIVIINRRFATPANFGTTIAKINSSIGYRFQSNGTTLSDYMQFGDGTNTVYPATGTYTAGTLLVEGFVSDRSANTAVSIINGTYGTSVSTSSVGSISNTGALQIGRASAGAGLVDMEFVAAAIFRRALTASEITTITNYYTGRVGA